MINTEPNAKNQHYVWQHYLSAWAAEGTFCCYRQNDRKLFLTRPKAIASQSYFYQTQQLTDADKEFLEDFISKASDERLRALNRDYVKLTQLSFVRSLRTPISLATHVLLLKNNCAGLRGISASVITQGSRTNARTSLIRFVARVTPSITTTCSARISFTSSCSSTFGL
jgi:hypothetical protein